MLFGSTPRRSKTTKPSKLPLPRRAAELLHVDQRQQNWALNSWHWLFLAQPEPFPDTLMSAVPAEWFLKSRGYDKELPKIVFDEYVRCFTKKTIAGSCRHYRANATLHFEID